MTPLRSERATQSFLSAQVLALDRKIVFIALRKSRRGIDCAALLAYFSNIIFFDIARRSVTKR